MNQVLRWLVSLSRAQRATLGALLAAAALACAVGSRAGVPVQSWWQARGPVVPHDTFPADCSLCHTSEGWRTIRSDFVFDHAAETGLALTGAHAQAECLRCHNDRGPAQIFAARGCRGCHVDVHQGEMGSDCLACHTEADWRPDEVIAQHDRTRFPLVGAHVAAACWRCHPGAQAGNFARADTACIACHTDDLARATQPDHAAQGWVDDCERCHVPIAWGGGSFNHSTWPLTGQHLAAACDACHSGGVYSGVPTQCVDCHLPDYQGAQDPDHVALGISTACQQCHTTNGWSGAQFDHGGIVNGCVNCHQSDYQGAQDPDHVALGISTACEQCHGTNTWQGAQFDHTGIANGCVNCHQSDYQGAQDPDHVALGISTNCEQCHGTNTWQGAQFDHTGIADGCVNCHLPDYQSAQPNHVSAGFPTTCELCHTTSHWDGATFSHSFPINSGPHNPFSCVQCHLVPGDYQQFSCTHCHEHRQSKMDQEHQGEPGYVWQSAACLACHPNGTED